MSYHDRCGSSYGKQIRKARRVQVRRSDHAKHLDDRLKAPIAKMLTIG